MITKRAFLTVVPGHSYEVPQYTVVEGIGIQETGRTLSITFVRGSKVTEENTFPSVTGTLHEHLLTVQIEDLKLKAAEFPSKETEMAIIHLEEARHWLEEREKVREAAGLLGTYQPHR